MASNHLPTTSTAVDKPQFAWGMTGHMRIKDISSKKCYSWTLQHQAHYTVTQPCAYDSHTKPLPIITMHYFALSMSFNNLTNIQPWWFHFFFSPHLSGLELLWNLITWCYFTWHHKLSNCVRDETDNVITTVTCHYSKLPFNLQCVCVYTFALGLAGCKGAIWFWWLKVPLSTVPLFKGVTTVGRSVYFTPFKNLIC